MPDAIPENPNRIELEIYKQFADRVEDDPEDPFEMVLCSNFDEYEPVLEKVLDAYGAGSLEELQQFVGDPAKNPGRTKVGVAYKLNDEFVVEVDGEPA